MHVLGAVMQCTSLRNVGGAVGFVVRASSVLFVVYAAKQILYTLIKGGALLALISTVGDVTIFIVFDVCLAFLFGGIDACVSVLEMVCCAFAK